MGKFVSTSTALQLQDGTVVAYANKEYYTEAADRFSYLYDNEWSGWIKKTKSVSTLKIFFALALLQEVGNPVVYFSPVRRREIISEYDLSEVSLYSALSELEDYGVIIRGDVVDPDSGEVIKSVGRGQIILNPFVVWRGEARERRTCAAEFMYYLNLRRKADGTR